MSTSILERPRLQPVIPPRQESGPPQPKSQGGLIVFGAVFLVICNVGGVAVQSHGAPAYMGLIPVFLLVIPLMYQLFGTRKLVMPEPFFFLILFLIAQIGSTLFSDYPDEASAQLVEFVLEGLVPYFLIVNVIRTPTALRRALWAVTSGLAFLALLSVFQWMTKTFDRPYGGFATIPLDYLSGFSTMPRAAGPLGDPNYFAQILLIGVPIALFLVWVERARWLKLVAVAAVALGIGGILLTFSRGAGLALAVTFLVMVFFRSIRPRYVLLVVLVMVLALALVPAYWQRVTTVTSVAGATDTSGGGESDDTSIRSRATEMLAAGYVFADHPIAGVGPGLFPLYYQSYAKRFGHEVHEKVKWGKDRGEVAPPREAHNMYLSVAAETGLPGLFTFGGTIVVTLLSLVRVRRLARVRSPDLSRMATSIFLAIIAYLTAGLFLSLAFQRYYWLLLALGAAPSLMLERTGQAGLEEGHDPVELSLHRLVR